MPVFYNFVCAYRKNSINNNIICVFSKKERVHVWEVTKNRHLEHPDDVACVI